MSRSVIITSYLTTAIDPQRGVFATSGDPRKMMLLFTAVQLGLEVVIHHDNLSDEFCDRFGSDLVKFVRVPPVPPGRTVYTHRQYCAFDYLVANEDCATAFCTGLFDVCVVRDPHALIDGTHKIWAANEPSLIVPEEVSGQWLIDEIRAGYGQMFDDLLGRRLLNSDIFGGSRDNMIEFLKYYLEEIERSPGSSTEMGSFNVAAHLRMPAGSVWANGAPLHSVFKQYENRLDVAFLHK